MPLVTQAVLTQALTHSSSAALHTIGTLHFDFTNIKTYRYILAAAACIDDTLNIGQPISADTGGAYYANNDLAGGTGIGTVPLGVGIAAIAETYYGWIQVEGVSEEMTGDGSVAEGEFVVPDVSNDKQIDTMAAGEEAQVMGWALADDAPAVNIMISGLL